MKQRQLLCDVRCEGVEYLPVNFYQPLLYLKTVLIELPVGLETHDFHCTFAWQVRLTQCATLIKQFEIKSSPHDTSYSNSELHAYSSRSYSELVGRIGSIDNLFSAPGISGTLSRLPMSWRELMGLKRQLLH
eukprot:6177827-Amphidinium_carterae.1